MFGQLRYELSKDELSSAHTPVRVTHLQGRRSQDRDYAATNLWSVIRLTRRCLPPSATHDVIKEDGQGSVDEGVACPVSFN